MGTEHESLVEINLLRAFVIAIDGVRIHITSSAQRLVAFLALHRQTLTRAYISGMLWPETTIQKANASLRSAIWRIQRSCTAVIVANPHELSLAPHCIVDVGEVERHARRLLDPARSCDDILSPRTCSDLAADLLPGWYTDDWIIVHREQFHQLRLHALEAMCSRLTQAGRYGEAVEAGLAAVRAEPLRESAHGALINAHLAAGNRAEALRQYERCRCVLLDELGLEPSISFEASAGMSAATHRNASSGGPRSFNVRDPIAGRLVEISKG
jgi:DNA-binding SARP family transcriptional activator